MMKCIAEIEHIPKHIVMKAITDMNLRAKWDRSMGTLEVLEHDKRQDKTVVKLNMNVPYHLQAREQVYVRKVMKDFPSAHQDMIVRASCEHARAPIN
jgi:START domain